MLAAAGFAPSLRRIVPALEGGLELDFEAFLSEAVPLARYLVGDTSRAGQDRYLHALASLAAALRDLPIPSMKETTAMGAAGRTFLGVNECDAPFTVLHWRLEPGARIGLHPHLYGNVVTVCLAGEVRIENWELAGALDFDTQDSFVARRTTDQVLAPGNVNLVNLEHGYVHGFTAGPGGARGLDLTTRIKEKRPTPTLVVGEAEDAQRVLDRARWKHG